MRIGKEVSKYTVELARDLLEKAYARGFISKILKVRQCPVDEAIMVAQEVLMFVEKNIDSILQSLRGDPYCQRRCNRL